jgi:prefoldin subunit 5
MSNDFDPLAAVSAMAGQPGDFPEIRISAADRPPGDRRREEPQAESGPTAARTRLLKRAGKTGATLAACALAGLAGWGLYGVVVPQSAGWFDFIANKTAQLSAPPVDLVPVTQKLQAEIEALQRKVEALEKSRSANTKSLASVEKSLGSLDGMNRRIDETKTETKAEIDALSGRVAALQQETNAKLSELSAAQPARKRGARPVENRAAPAEPRQRQAARRNDAFDPSQHPGAPGAPRPLGAP